MQPSIDLSIFFCIYRTVLLSMCLSMCLPLSLFWNTSDEDVSCIAPATRHASFQLSHACKPSFLKRLQNPHVWHASQDAESIDSTAPATQSDAWTRKSGPNVVCFATSKSGPNMWCVSHILAAACNFSTSQLPKVPENGVFCAFSLRHVLHATAVCFFGQVHVQKWSEPEVF